jgi:hypothetical protein
MSGGRGSSTSHCYEKEWSSIFSKSLGFKGQGEFVGSFVDYKRGLNADCDDFRIFLQDCESSVPFSQAEEILESCQHSSLADLKSGIGSAGHRRDAWLDDKTPPCLKGGKEFRGYDNPLSATSLYQKLKIPVRGESSLRFLAFADKCLP